jgi:hypothetical protein
MQQSLILSTKENLHFFNAAFVIHCNQSKQNFFSKKSVIDIHHKCIVSQQTVLNNSKKNDHFNELIDIC